MSRTKQLFRALWIVACLPLCGLLIWSGGGFGALIAGLLLLTWLKIVFKPGWLLYIGIAAVVGGIALFPHLWNELNDNTSAPLSTYYNPPAVDDALYEYRVSSRSTETIWRTEEDHLAQWTPDQKELFTGNIIDGMDRLQASIGLALIVTGLLCILVYAMQPQVKEALRTTFRPLLRLIGRGGEG